MIGERFGGYEILALLGQGAMGAVYRARQVSLGREVALKVMKERENPESSSHKRFHREMQIHLQLVHPNLVRVLDADTVDGAPFLSMELVTAGHLGQWLTGKRSGDPVLLRKVLEPVAEALAYLHEARIFHRDLKPANVLLDDAGVMKVTDFGLARRALDAGLTRHNQILGTPRYLSPEMARGEGAAAPADVYALGVIAYEIAAATLPHPKGPNVVDYLARVASSPPTPLHRSSPNLPAGLAQLVMDMLALEPEERPTAREVLDRLEAMASENVSWVTREAPGSGAVTAVLEPQHRPGAAPSHDPFATLPGGMDGAPRRGASTMRRAGAGLAIVAAALVAGAGLGRHLVPVPPPSPYPTMGGGAVDPDIEARRLFLEHRERALAAHERAITVRGKEAGQDRPLDILHDRRFESLTLTCLTELTGAVRAGLELRKEPSLAEWMPLVVGLDGTVRPLRDAVREQIEDGILGSPERDRRNVVTIGARLALAIEALRVATEVPGAAHGTRATERFILLSLRAHIAELTNDLYYLVKSDLPSSLPPPVLDHPRRHLESLSALAPIPAGEKRIKPVPYQLLSICQRVSLDADRLEGAPGAALALEIRLALLRILEDLFEEGRLPQAKGISEMYWRTFVTVVELTLPPLGDATSVTRGDAMALRLLRAMVVPVDPADLRGRFQGKVVDRGEKINAWVAAAKMRGIQIPNEALLASLARQNL